MFIMLTRMFTCTKCSNGFYLYNNTCIQCHETCNKCYGSNESECYECKEGYLLQNNKCVKCSESRFGCEKPPESCTSCPKGKYLINGRCDHCDNLCEECDFHVNYCTKCKDDNFAYKGKCYSSCFEIGFGFGSNDTTTCHKCEYNLIVLYMMIHVIVRNAMIILHLL